MSYKYSSLLITPLITTPEPPSTVGASRIRVAFKGILRVALRVLNAIYIVAIIIRVGFGVY